MSRWLGLRARWRDLLRRRDAEARLDEELQFHLDMEVEHLRRQGVPDEEARRQARAAFGGAAVHRDAAREAMRLAVLDAVIRDVRVAWRGMRRTPAFMGIAAATLALGIGMATTMVGVVDAVRRDGRVVRAIDDVAVIWSSPPNRPDDHLPWTFRDLTAIAQAGTTLAGVAGVIFQGASRVVLTDGPDTWPAAATWVTGDFFRVLGVRPTIGRLLDPSDDVAGGAPVMVISHAAWQRHFGGAADVIGRSFTLNGLRHRIVGVVPSGFAFPRNADLWLPVLPSFPATREASGASSPDVMLFDLVARRKQGTTMPALRADLTRFLRATDAQRAPDWRGALPTVVPLVDRLTGDLRATTRAGLVAVGILLLVACVNVATLLLIRGGARGHELAIRQALGASRGRLIRQLVTEAGVLALLGGAGGVAFAWLGAGAVRELAPADIPHRELIALDGTVLAAAVVLTGLATLLSGVLPAVMLARGDLAGLLRGGRDAPRRHGAARQLRHALVAGQVALAMVVLTAAGLVTRSLLALQRVDLGFDASGLTVVETVLPPNAVPDRAQQVAVQSTLLERLRSLPGVVRASALTKPPYAAEGGWLAPVSAEGQSDAAARRNPFADLEVVGDQFVETLGLPIIAGRTFDARDRADAPAVTVVSAMLARRLWPGASAIGQRIKLGPPDGRGPWMQVIGVVGDTRFRDLSSARSTLYLPTAQFPGPVPMTIALRTASGGSPTANTIRQALSEVHPELRLASSGSFGERMRAPMARPRFGAALFLAFGAVTLLLCLVGMAGAIAAIVQERRHEFGIRLALGETPGGLQLRVLRAGAWLTAGGIVAGLLLALGTSHWLQSLLYVVSPQDPVTYGAALVIVGLTSIGACWWPARRASAVSPLEALREAAS